MDFSSFLTSLGTSCLIFLFLMLLFTWLSRRPGNRVVYYPNRIIKGMEPWDGSGRRLPFAWIREALSSTEEDIIAISGVDSAVYFFFLTTVLGILVLAALLLLPILLPIAATDHHDKNGTNSTTSNNTFSELDQLAMGQVEEKSPRLWAFLLATYWVSFVSFFLLWRAYKHISVLRATALASPEVKPEQFAVLVRDIPKPEGQTRKEQVESYFKKLYPETFYRAMIVTDNKAVNKIYKELEGYKKKLAHTEAVYASQTKESGNTEGTRPTNKTGCLGLIGKKVDSIEHYNEKIKELTLKLEAEQKVTLQEKEKSSAIIFFTSRVAAATVSQNIQARLVDTWRTMEAPEPRQIIWSNLCKSFYERQTRQALVYIFVFLLVVFFMVPITFVSAFTTLDNLRRLLPFLKPIVDLEALKTVLEAYLPQLALLIFLALLPKLLLFLSTSEGIASRGHAIRAASGKYFYFSVINVFIGVTVAGTIFGTIKKIQKDTSLIIPLLANGIPANATFFLTFVALRFFIGYGLELSRIIPLLIFHIKRKYVCKTEAELKEAWYPSDLGYGTRMTGDMLIFTIVICYSVIAPIILPFGVLYFGLGWLVLRNQVLKVYVPAYETYGRMWPHLHSRALAALILFQIIMFGYFGVKKFYYAPLILILPILSIIFWFVCRKKFYKGFQNTPIEVASHELKGSPNMEQVYRAFVPASLGGDKMVDDHSEEVLSQYIKTGPGAV